MRDSTHSSAGWLTSVWDAPGPCSLPTNMDRGDAVAAWRVCWKWLARRAMRYWSVRRARSSQVPLLIRTLSNLEVQAALRLSDHLGDIRLSSVFPAEAAAILSCRLDPSIVGSRSGPWRLEVRAAKLSYWLARGLRRNLEYVAARQQYTWAIVTDRQGISRVVVRRREDGQVVRIDGLEVWEEEVEEG